MSGYVETLEASISPKKIWLQAPPERLVQSTTGCQKYPLEAGGKLKTPYVFFLQPIVAPSDCYGQANS